MPITHIVHRSPPRLKMVRIETVRHGKHFIERTVYIDEKGKEHIKTTKQSKFF